MMKKKPRNPAGKIRFKILTLSETTREDIKKLLPNVSPKTLGVIFWQIESLCNFCAGTEADSDAVVRPKMLQGKRTLKDSVQIRIKNLLNALEGLDEYTKQILAVGYSVAYPHPEVSDKDKANAETLTRAMLNNQDAETSIWVPHEYSGSGWVESCGRPLPFRELLTRVKYACERSKDHEPKRTGLINGSEKVFVSQLIGIFETYTGKKATATSGGIFDKFLYAVCNNLDPDYPDGKDQSTIIKKALAFKHDGLRLQKKQQADH